MLACGKRAAGHTGCSPPGGERLERVRLSQAVREFLWGMTGYEFAQQALEVRASMESLFMLVVFGDLIGVPILPPYYGLRLLPLVVPQIQGWKRRVLRERGLGDDHEHHLHGL